MSVAALRGWTPSIAKPSVLPGFGITLGFAVSYLSLIVLIPLAVLVWRASALGIDGIWRVATTPQVSFNKGRTNTIPPPKRTTFFRLRS